MVARLFSFLNKTVGNMHRAAYVLGFFALCSQALAVVRDRVFAHSFGASELLDIYFTAFRIPDLMFVAVASFVSLSVMVPFLTEREKQDPVAAQEFFSNILTAFVFVMALVAIVLFIAIPYLAPNIFSGFEGESLRQLILITRLLLLQPIFLGLSNLFASVTQVRQKFIVYAITPVLYNLGIIFGALVLYPILGLPGMAWGVVLGAALHAAIQIPILHSEGYAVWPRLKTNWRDIWKVLKLSLPRTVTLSATQLLFIWFYAIAADLAEGSISAFSFGFNVQSVPLSIIGVSYSLAAFPTLARLYSEGEIQAFADHITKALRHIVLWATPVAVLAIVLRAQIVRVLLGSGAFTWDDTRLTAAVFALFALSLVAQSLVLLFLRGCYAAGRTWRPLSLTLFSNVIIVGLVHGFLLLWETQPVFRFFLEQTLRLEGVAGQEIVLLPLAYSIGVWINAVLLWWFFDRMVPEFRALVVRSMVRITTSSLLAGFVSYGVLQLMAEKVDMNTFIGVASQGLVAAVAGLITGVITLAVLGAEELNEIKTTLLRIIRR